ncbi:Gibberellin 2-beta-dioxygenase 8 [Acorus calamus]|uniref:Gibberellin 2-beta-dioxygenase 8 n=1 Tax=Acorus calamus TaxID=4465 RepID=A0AAV9FN30_ACOCL|nr:Gibberellin 2-beta-dioxygenase 8 [Acorus calamus]
MLDSSVTNPPFLNHYESFFDKTSKSFSNRCSLRATGECDLPIIDLGALRSSIEGERKACVKAIAKASSEWGFFQVLNHGVSQQLLMEMRREQVKVFDTPFEKKASCGILNDSYRWGTPSATSLEQFSWSEAFHVPLNKISQEGCCPLEFTSLREAMEKLAEEMSKLARTLAGVLAKNAWSNDLYKSVKHKVVANKRVERYSIAYFLCPSYDSVIGSCSGTSLYKQFTFGEFRRQVQEDVKTTGQKVGLPRFLI